MASRVNVCSVNVLDNPAKFTDPFKLEVTFEVFEPLAEDLDWELLYVGSAESEKYDQVLDSVLVGPVVEGRHKFIFEVGGPDVSKIPQDDIVGVTVLLLKCSYMEQEFINIGWFVATEYTDLELRENPPSTPILEKLERKVCIDDVRVTTFAIQWDKNQQEEIPEVDETDEVSDTARDAPSTNVDNDTDGQVTESENISPTRNLAGLLLRLISFTYILF
uniref:Histone chaperone asf1 n=1 Tax=Syphacia muris TaxID=451379 RepID=A0A0N5AQ04_9BILA